MAATTQVQILVRTGSRAAARGWGPSGRAERAPALRPPVSGSTPSAGALHMMTGMRHASRAPHCCRNIRAVATRSAAQRESLASSPFPSRAASLSGQVADVSLAGQKRYTVLLDTLATLPLHQVLIV